MKEKREDFDISALLNEATEENDRARALQEKRNAEAEKLTKTIVMPPVGSETEEHAAAKPRRDLDAETIELIDKYSTREIRDERSNTLELKETLARKLQGDKLLGYLERNPTAGSRKADHLRTIIRQSGQISADEMEKRVVADVSDRFTDEADLPAKENFEQAEMFPLGDGMTLKEQQKTPSVATFDRDYEALGKKVMQSGVPSEDSDDGQLSFMTDETDVTPVDGEMDETELNLRLAFDMMEDSDGAGEALRSELFQKKKTKKSEKDVPILRYTDRSQNSEIDGKLRAARRKAMIRLAISAVLLLCFWIFETSGKDGMLGYLLDSGKTGVRLYVLLDLQLLFFCGLAVLPSLVRGLQGIFSRKPVPESMLVLGMFWAAAYAIGMAVVCPAEVHVYGLPIALGALCAALADYQTARRNCHAFRMIATKKPKYIAERLENAVKESEEFGRYLYEDSELYTVRRTDFVEGFSERSVKRPKYDDLYRFLLPLVAVAAVALLVTMIVLGRDPWEAFVAASALVAFSTPSTAFFVIGGQP